MSQPPLLDIQNLVKRFGALLATDHVSLQVFPNEIHALIGPNGAGKTSLVAQLSGLLTSDSGHILFQGQDITALSTHERVHLGLARSFQITRLFKSFTVLENVALSVQAQMGHSFSFWKPVSQELALTDKAMSLLNDLGLAPRAHDRASELSHGEQRILELGLAVATQPKLLLLDEPMAGAGPVESERILNLILKLRQQSSILLIEHDMDAVFRLADRISVLVSGAVIATGTPEEIRHHPQVIAAYLGEENA
ncbi:ABC transporter ATP-binding protein [Limnohabitans sp. Rim11]|jgi:branched-chain amino acid transport system ATP-binding protein|uniref:ABC transporter ATP-binding protein n=1 Tax=Limnohabitans sp. Rim11 TaxID=1100719 RepID=UPI000A9E1CBE|nr:ABC transporter ATP-binding protein [Limnohabitans sp. Rim11]